ncbi:hypothetical protein D9758_003092 [Tetrapyrgos nigripes]|uniref:FAD/NAD(P)-binding domain-containing protein n=1 Tax=Tetrapyrgos nigripes TaxID=182062 RepID=A0A8H5GQI4_9AGAR|nr:hypothetical protein D9758_003092 [Tetrapyrgos nigripes]
MVRSELVGAHTTSLLLALTFYPARLTELAGEIKDIWPSKPVTILHRSDKLITAGYPDRYRRRIAAQLKARGVSFILDNELDMDVTGTEKEGELKTFRTKSGRTIKADLVVCLSYLELIPGQKELICINKSNTSFLSSSPLSSLLTPSGITSTFQLSGFPHIRQYH